MVLRLSAYGFLSPPNTFYSSTATDKEIIGGGGGSNEFKLSDYYLVLKGP